MTGRRCTVPGCGRGHYSRGYCRPHYVRWRHHGDTRPDVPIGAARRRGCSNRSVRRHLQAERGPATGQPCDGCGAAALVWSYDGNDPAARTDSADGRRYSADLRRYRPLCHACERRTRTRRGRAPLDVDRAARLYRAGATSRGVGALLGVSPSTVLRALRAHGVAIRPPVRTRHRQLHRPR